MSECDVPGDVFPAALCCALRQLASLEMLCCESIDLPPAFSQLRQATWHCMRSAAVSGVMAAQHCAGSSTLAAAPACSRLCSALQQLLIEPGWVDVGPIRGLRGLTFLHLQSCNLQGLPDGPYLSNLKRCARCRSRDTAAVRSAAVPMCCTRRWLTAWPASTCRSLNVSDNPALGSPIPFAATAARGLRALQISCPEEEEQDWVDLEWKLHCFPKLEVRVQQAGGTEVVLRAAASAFHILAGSRGAARLWQAAPIAALSLHSSQQTPLRVNRLQVLCISRWRDDLKRPGRRWPAASAPPSPSKQWAAA